MKRPLVGAVLGFLCALVASGPSGAQTYPARPLTMIVPFAAGGPTDTLARVLAQAMSVTLKQSVIVENVPGNSGAVEAQRLIRASPDG